MITNRYRKLWFAAAVCALMVPAVHAAEFNNITLGRDQDFTVVTLFTSGPTQATHQMVEAKDGKPNRIVVDLAGARHDLSQNNFSNLPEGNIKAIRTSQFAVQPEPVVRIVLDLGYVAAYRLESSDNSVKVFVSAPSDPPIAQEWSARTGVRQPVLATAKPAGSGISWTVAPPQPQEEPTVAATPVAEPQSEPSSPTLERETIAASTTQTTPVGETSPTVATMDESHQADLSQAQEPTTTVATEPAVTESGSDAHSSVLPVPMPQTQSSQEIDYNVPAPAGMQLADQSSSSSTASPTEQTPVSPEVSEPMAVESHAEPVSEPAMAEHSQEPISEDPMPSEPSPAVTPLDDEGSEALASLSTLPPIPATATDVVPVRTQISYHTMGRRDPFAPLVQSGTAYNKTGLPDVSTLRLVGILHDVGAKWGLFEDANGFGYILREGDRVRNGHLAKLTQNKAYFQLTEFGWSRAVELDLEREEG